MSEQFHTAGTQSGGTTNGKHSSIGGLVLIAAGLVLLAGQVFTLGAWPVVILGVLFTVTGVATRTAGWLIPGGVLGGIGAGALLITSGVATTSAAEGGVFLLAFALGWVSVYVLSRLFTPEPQLWALIPGAVLGLIGGALLAGSAGALALELVFGALAYAWPLALIVVGLVMLLRLRK